MDLTAKLVQILPLQKGQGKNGEWKKQDIIVETGGQYPKKVCISIWGDKINEKALQIGNTLNISFDVESREYNGRWYTDVKAWKVEAAGNTTGAATAAMPMKCLLILTTTIRKTIYLFSFKPLL
ncbi:DUF3127 domain-containing protein [Niabella sp. W65]|nr:DUF3127 domain-containing protein [Niabella sp. W65]MCH7369571.1 DUF3127 domain-containing protein [Niabella sp. W65]ULT45113.1 DUF3127 domain-containing protein [Niabella sp. I65]